MKGYKIGDIIKITKTDYVGDLKDVLLNGVHEIVEVGTTFVRVRVGNKAWTLMRPQDGFHKAYKKELEEASK